ncbi:uncharacterized protein BKCO1_8000201 [Diplodia corticola]|uniref:Uncharacterized protein n=1 Tax=Diplodia corticola TaxID=236234 RepID=A0A1J9RWS6_9PEZI|nr:uncharacterized protein BKCO1_8000201 [Diplodia corticola]OJD37091.1 hypothetical protein BKCO1_8000201 [Diplodia corticola]
MFQSTLNRPYRNILAISLFLICHSLSTNGVLASPAGRARHIYAPPPPVHPSPSYSPAILYNAATASNTIIGPVLLDLDAVVAAEARSTGRVPVVLPANGIPSARFEGEGIPTARNEQRVDPASAATATARGGQPAPTWGVTVTEGSHSYIRQSPTYVPVASTTCSATICKDYMNLSCSDMRYGGCWNMCVEDRKYLAPDCVETPAPAADAGTAKPTAAPMALATPTAAA